MRVINLLALTISFLFFQCQSNTQKKQIEYINHGWSFGMCQGYCHHETKITPLARVYTQTSADNSKYPSLTDSTTLTHAQWKSIVNSFDIEEFEITPETVGCPDCADGGAEWIEIKYGNKVRKVTFEYGKDFPPFTNLLGKVREKK